MFIFLTFPGTSMTKLALPWLSDVSSKFTLSFLLAVFPMLILLPECVVPVTEMDIGIPRAGVLSGYFRSTCQCRQEIEVIFLKWNKFFCARLDLAYVVPWMYSRYHQSLFLNINKAKNRKRCSTRYSIRYYINITWYDENWSFICSDYGCSALACSFSKPDKKWKL